GVFGVALAEATSYTLVLHAALVVPVVLLGVFFIWQDWRASDEGSGGLITGLHAMRGRNGRVAGDDGRQTTDDGRQTTDAGGKTADREAPTAGDDESVATGP